MKEIIAFNNYIIFGFFLGCILTLILTTIKCLFHWMAKKIRQLMEYLEQRQKKNLE